MSVSARVRARAAQIVAAVAQGRSLDAMLADDRTPPGPERSFLRSLCYDSVRWYLRLDALLGRLLSRPNQKTPAEVRALAIVGLCQLIHTDVAAHAAVAETVEAARVLGYGRATGMINAVLRRAQREQGELFAELDRDLAVRTAHPRWLVDRLAEDWGARCEEILAANNERPPFWIRVNRLKTSGAAYRKRLEAQGVAVKASACNDEALLLERPLEVADLPGFAQGEASVQDAAAQLAARLVDPRPGERILDACAAPGGKTGHLLELAPDVAELVAIDASSERLARVRENLERLGLRATVLAADATEPRDWFDGRLFDRILVDAPCSGTGVIRRHPDIKLLRRADDIAPLARRQLELLEALWPLLAPGGRLVYASCSALAEETTEVSERFLRAHADARDVTAQVVAAFGHLPGAERGLRIAAGTGAMDGFYYDCFEKNKG